MKKIAEILGYGVLSFIGLIALMIILPNRNWTPSFENEDLLCNNHKEWFAVLDEKKKECISINKAKDFENTTKPKVEPAEGASFDVERKADIQYLIEYLRLNSPTYDCALVDKEYGIKRPCWKVGYPTLIFNPDEGENRY